MKEQLIHILDQSVCLSRKQMKEYLSGTMLPEEMHAAEIHLSACPLCSMAMEGFEEHDDEALAAIASLNSGFLKEHFDNIAPQIHLNSISPAAALDAAHAGKKRGTVQPLWRTASVAAMVLLAVGTLWYIRRTGRSSEAAKTTIAMADNSPAAIDASTGRMGDAQALKQNAVRALNADQQTSSPIISTLPAKGPESKIASPSSAPVQDTAKSSFPSLASAAADDKPALSLPAPARQPEERGRAQERSKDEAASTRRYSNAEGALAAGGPHVTNNNALLHTDDRASLLAKADKSKARNTADAVSQTGDIAALPTQQAPPAVSGSISIGGGRSTGDKYVVDGVQVTPSATPKKPAFEVQTRSHLELGDEAYNQGKYSTALTFYNRQMNTGIAKDRSRAAIRAAKCYAALGNTVKAKQLLQGVVDDATGQERRIARRMLRDMD